MGAGNKALELAIAQQLMEYRNLYDPEPQRDILRDVTLAITDDPGRATRLVPDKPASVTDSVHDAQLAAGSLMLGLPVAIKTGMNHIDYVDSLLASMALIISNILKAGGVGTPDKVRGLQNMAAHTAAHIEIIAQDKAEKARVKQYMDQLGKLMNEVKAFAQRMQQQAQAGNGGAPGVDPKDIAKIQADQMKAEAKVKNTRESHAQRTVQRQIQFEQQMKQDAQRHQLEMRKEADQIALEQQKSRSKALEE